MQAADFFWSFWGEFLDVYLSQGGQEELRETGNLAHGWSEVECHGKADVDLKLDSPADLEFFVWVPLPRSTEIIYYFSENDNF